MKFRLLVPLSVGILLSLLFTTSFTRRDISAASGAYPRADKLSIEEIQPVNLSLPLVVKNPDLIRFTHGVASGEVTTATAVLWTRVDQAADLVLELSSDPNFSSIFQQTNTVALTETDFTAKTTVGGLSPGEEYYYRWRHIYATSVTGTFKTAPTPVMTRNLQFAYSGDSDGTLVSGQPAYNNFEVLDAARLDGLDFFVYLGDTIYSDSGLRPSPATTLEEYREIYKVTKEYQALADLMRATSVYAIWDDHEVVNDFAGQTVDPARYATGRQAFLEYMPLTDLGLPQDGSCAGDPLFRIFRWGQDVDIIILDERSCRAEAAIESCMITLPIVGDIPDPLPTAPASIRTSFELPIIGSLPPSPPAGCLEAINDPDRTLLGPVQKQLLKDFLINSTASFKIVINEVPIQQLYVLPYDRWEGFGAERTEILNYIRDNNIENVVFLTADSHANFINEVFIDNTTDPEPLAYEFVTGPIATTTMQQGILNLGLGQEGLDGFNDILDGLGVDCRHLDVYSYGLASIDTLSTTLTVSLRDDTGSILLDQDDQVTPCIMTLE